METTPPVDLVADAHVREARLFGCCLVCWFAALRGSVLLQAPGLRMSLGRGKAGTSGTVCQILVAILVLWRGDFYVTFEAC